MAVTTGTAALIGAGVGAAGSLYAGRQARKGAEGAAATQADAQREALEYLREREAIPQQFREGALQVLGGMYGLEGGEGSQQMLIDQAMQSPLYQAYMGSREAGEEAILRNAAMTGGLRSGDVQSNLYDYNVRLENEALLNAYNQQLSGLQGLANLPSNANQIAQGIAGIGQTQAQGQLASAQIMQNAYGDAFNLLGSGIGNYLAMGSGGPNTYSDGTLI